MWESPYTVLLHLSGVLFASQSAFLPHPTQLLVHKHLLERSQLQITWAHQWKYYCIEGTEEWHCDSASCYRYLGRQVWPPLTYKHVQQCPFSNLGPHPLCPLRLSNIFPFFRCHHLDPCFIRVQITTPHPQSNCALSYSSSVCRCQCHSLHGSIACPRLHIRTSCQIALHILWEFKRVNEVRIQ